MSLSSGISLAGTPENIYESLWVPEKSVARGKEIGEGRPVAVAGIDLEDRDAERRRSIVKGRLLPPGVDHGVVEVRAVARPLAALVP